MSARDVTLDDLWGACAQLEPDALRVLAGIAKRLVHGQKEHGILNVAVDRRSWLEEMISELDDGLVYLRLVALRLEQVMTEEETRRCDSLNARARQNRTSYVVRADAAEVVGETCTTPTSTRPTDWECGAV
jgi:hypothetical protein